LESIQTNIKERVIELANIKNVRLEKFFSDLGVTYGSFKGKNKDSSLNSSVISTIYKLYPDVNLEWLVCGIGTPLKQSMGMQPILGGHNIVANNSQNVGNKVDSSDKNSLIAELKQHIQHLKTELDRKDVIISHLLSLALPSAER